MEGIPPAKVSPGRWRLGFKEAVLAAFAFLEGMGFRVVRAEMTFVRYESPRVFVNVYHGRASYELGVEIGLGGPFGPAEARFSGHDLYFALRHFGIAWPQHGFAASNPDGMRQFASELGRLTAALPTPLLSGNGAAWERFEAAEGKRRERATAAFELEQKLYWARQRAEEARAAGDWPGVAEAYEAIAADLTPVERRRLEYARKHANNAGSGGSSSEPLD